MLPRHSYCLAIVMTLASAGHGAMADVPDWVRAYTAEALAAPVTLENAQRYRWYQIGVAVRSDHPLVYDLDIRPMQLELQRHGNAVSAELKARLNDRFAAIRSVEDAGPYYRQCGWILTRPGGEPMTPVQSELLAYCEQKAVPALYERLLRERAQHFDIRLATLRDLDVIYPARTIGTTGDVGRSDVPAIYARALSDRLDKAKAQVIADLGDHFRIKSLGDNRLQTDVAQCRDLLGRWYPEGDPLRSMALSDPLASASAETDAALGFSQTVGVACRREAKAWLMRQQPGIDAAIKADVAALDPNRLPILSVGTRCAAILGRWFPSFEKYDVALTGPLSQTCRRGVIDLNAKATVIQAKVLADRFESAPETLAGLEANGWFEAQPGDVRAISDAGDPDRAEVERALASRTAAMIQPKRDVALRSAVTSLGSGFTRTDPSDAELRPVRKVCGPYVGRAGRELPSGGSEIRQAVGSACQAGEKVAGLRRAKSALAAAHIENVLGDAQLGLTAPDGRVSFADPRRIVVAAAGNGLQVTFEKTGWLFWSRTQMRIRSPEQDTASLVGRLEIETRADGVRVWRIVELPSLPGFDGPAATMACLTQGQGAADTVLAFGLAAALSFYVDAPHTGIAMIGGAAETAAVSDRCAGARQNTFAGPYAAVQ